MRKTGWGGRLTLDERSRCEEAAGGTNGALIALVLAAETSLGRLDIRRKLVSYPGYVLLRVPAGGLMGLALFQILFLVEPAFRDAQAEYAPFGIDLVNARGIVPS